MIRHETSDDADAVKEQEEVERFGVGQAANVSAVRGEEEEGKVNAPEALRETLSVGKRYTGGVQRTMKAPIA